MTRTAAIGHQDFATIRENNYFYIDKTSFIREWWESGDIVTLITRPRRFGKTLCMSTIDYFFSVKNAGRTDLFDGLCIWENEKYKKLQGTYPVIFLSFAGIKEQSFTEARKSICRTLEELYNQFDFLLDGELLNEKEKEYYGKRVIILLDEYDTPMQEAYMNGYWNELASFTRALFNMSFKTNPYLERAVMTGITRVGKESIFSDLNNLEVITTTSDKYTDAFGFTEEEVFEALDEYGLTNKKQAVKDWYDGFTFGCRRDIYNP